AEDVKSLKTHGAVGNLTFDDALQQILDGTGLTYRFLDSKTVSIVPSAHGVTNPSQLAPDGRENQAEAMRLTQTDAVDTPATTPSRSSTESAGITEVVVTAQKREETIDTVPISMTALSQRTLDDLHVQKLADLSSIVPGLAIIPPTNGSQS